MTAGYRCDNCKEFSQSKAWIFSCIECNKEICESCMYSWATCKECAIGKTDQFLKERFDTDEPDTHLDVLTRFLTKSLSNPLDSDRKSG